MPQQPRRDGEQGLVMAALSVSGGECGTHPVAFFL
jgi:hypothetical protein